MFAPNVAYKPHAPPEPAFRSILNPVSLLELSFQPNPMALLPPLAYRLVGDAGTEGATAVMDASMLHPSCPLSQFTLYQ